MIQAIYAQFLREHAAGISVENERRLSRRLLGYLCKTGSSKSAFKLLIEQARELGLERQTRQLRRELDGHAYVVSRFWRACWAVYEGTPPVEAAAHYAVNVTDLYWADAVLAARQKINIMDQTDGEWIRDADYRAITQEILTTRPYCRRLVLKKMRFLIDSDPSLTVEDLEGELLCMALNSALRYDWKTTDTIWLRNYSWRSTHNRAISLIKHHTAGLRKRIVRTKGAEDTVSLIKFYTRSACMLCRCPSAKAVCPACSAVPAARESVGEFMRTSTVSSLTAQVSRDSDVFLNTTISMDQPVSVAMDLKRGPHLLTHADLLATPRVSWDADTSDVVNDVMKQPAAVQNVCAVILGMDVPAFDAHLASWGLDREDMKTPALVKHACSFYGVRRSVLKACMAPVLQG